MPDADLLWWGFSSLHGWVALDRSIKQNSQPLVPIIFWRCSDECFYTEDRKHWKEPHYIFAPKYIQSQPAATQDALRTTLDAMKSKWNPEKASQALKAYEERELQITRTLLFEKLGLSTVPAIGPTSSWTRRRTHCWNCPRQLDSDDNFQCNKCRWLVCKCGACGCGHIASH